MATYNSFANASYLGDTTSAGEVFNYTSRTDQSTQAYFLGNLQYYSQLLIVLANLDVETAHASTLPQTASGYAPPAAAFNRAQRDLYTVGQAYQLAQQQVPEAINYPVYVDIGNRLLWSPAELSQVYQDLTQATEIAPTYSVGPFDGGWSIASTAQMQSLYDKALAIVGGNDEMVIEGYQQLLGIGNDVPPTQFFFVSDSSDAWDAYQGELVTTRDLPNGRAGAAFVRTIPNGTYGDSPYITVFNYGLTIDQPLTVTQNGNQMTALLPAYTSNFPTNQDITNLVSWTSSNTSVVDVSNVVSPDGATNTLAPGQLIFHGPGTATITATVIQGSSTLSGSATVTSTATPTLNGVLLSPQNILYNLLPQPVGTGGFGQQFYLTGFQTDLTAVDLTQSANTVFTLYQLPDATPIDPTTVNVSALTPVPSSVASFGSTGAGFLTINASGGVSPFTNGNLLVVATYTDPTTGTVTQQSSQLVMPVSTAPPPPPPNTSAPTIASVTPSSGTNAGGTAVTIRGKNFTGATSVTIAGRTAQFGVNSSSELTVNTPSYTGTGFVPLVVTTPNGSATTNFDYTD